MKTHAVQSVEIRTPFARAFAYIADPSTLPEWTHAFAAIRGRRAVMRTPAGEAEVDLEVQAVRESGTIDWTMTFSGGEVARAWSRVVPHGDDRVIYVFTMPAPPVPMERLEGTLAEQSRILSSELETLSRVLEHGV